MVQVSDHQLSYSSNLFKSEEDCPIAFYVYPSSDSSEIVQLIQGGGGSIVKVDHPGAIYLSSSSKYAEIGANCVSTSFIYSCCLKNKLLDIDHFRLKPAQSQLSSESIESLRSLFKSQQVRHGDIKNKKIWIIIRHITECDSLWKNIAESKECGDVSWKTLRNNFSLWAFLKLKSGEDNLLSHHIVPLKSDNSEGLSRITKKNLTSTSNPPVIMKEEDGHKETHHKDGSGSSETVEEIGDSSNILKPSTEEECLPLMNCEEKILVVSKSDSDVCSESHNFSPHLRDKILQKDISVREVANLVEVETEKQCLEAEDGTNEGGLGNSRWASSGVTTQATCNGKHSDNISKAFHNSSNNTEHGTSADAYLVSSDEGHIGEEIRQDFSHNTLEKSVSKTIEGNSEQSQGVELLGEDCTVIECVVKNKRTKEKSVVLGTWLGKDDMRKLSSGHDDLRPNSKEEIGQGKSEDKISVHGDDDDDDTDFEGKDTKITQLKRWTSTRLYSREEDLKLLQWVIKKRRRITSLYGNRVWQFMEKKNVLPNRSWQSMRERFRRHIAPNLKKYHLSAEDTKKLKILL